MINRKDGFLPGLFFTGRHENIPGKAYASTGITVHNKTSG